MAIPTDCQKAINILQAPGKRAAVIAAIVTIMKAFAGKDISDIEYVKMSKDLGSACDCLCDALNSNAVFQVFKNYYSKSRMVARTFDLNKVQWRGILTTIAEELERNKIDKNDFGDLYGSPDGKLAIAKSVYGVLHDLPAKYGFQKWDDVRWEGVDGFQQTGSAGVWRYPGAIDFYSKQVKKPVLDKQHVKEVENCVKWWAEIAKVLGQIESESSKLIKQS